jgi:hypothetical protein
MVGHFSRPKEWVLNLLSSLDIGLTSCMAYGHHCATVEVDPCQAMMLRQRVRQLVEKEEWNLLDTVLYAEVTSQPSLPGESQKEREEGS